MGSIDKMLDYGRQPAETGRWFTSVNVLFSASIFMSLARRWDVLAYLLSVFGLLILGVLAIKSKRFREARSHFALTALNFLITLLVMGLWT